MGSSPLTRGKPRLWACRSRLAGLIPAHAGKTQTRGRVSRPARAHPRSRGENVATDVRRANVSGSSPLTRGKLGGVGDDKHASGLIPAHAGKTRLAVRLASELGAHPRSRGENWAPSPASHTQAGSSPLTRGKRLVVDLATFKARLIPAHAGKTSWRGPARSRRGAHPRSRGENR